MEKSHSDSLEPGQEIDFSGQFSDGANVRQVNSQLGVATWSHMVTAIKTFYLCPCFYNPQTMVLDKEKGGEPFYVFILVKM